MGCVGLDMSHRAIPGLSFVFARLTHVLEVAFYLHNFRYQILLLSKVHKPTAFFFFFEHYALESHTRSGSWGGVLAPLRLWVPLLKATWFTGVFEA